MATPPDLPGNPSTGPPCARCRHHFVTYDAQLPHGCHLFGIRTRRLPSLVVREESGKDCAHFEPKPRHA